MSVEIPCEVEWWVHRVATSKFYRADPQEILSRWSWRTLWQAHLVINAFERKGAVG